MPKRGSDADSRIFFDELVSLGVSRLRATGAIRLEDRQILIPFGGQTKLIGVAHTVFKNGARGRISSAQVVAEGPKGFGLSAMRHAA